MTERSWAVVDVETECVKTPEGWSAMPWVKEAGTGHSPRPLLVGIQTVRVDGGVANIDATTYVFGAPEVHALEVVSKELATLIGHNIKFDAGHCTWINDHTVWDTMIAEYILTAQMSKFASLESLRAKYAPLLEKKDDLIARNLEAGIPPQNIPAPTLIEYLKSDLAITGAIFKCQWELATPEQRALILVQSTASLAYGEIESNGLHLDVPYTVEQRDYHAKIMESYRHQFADLYARTTGNAEDYHALLSLPSLFTPSILSTVFYGAPMEILGSVPLTDEEKATLPKSRKYKPVVIKGPTEEQRLALTPAAFGSVPMKAAPAIYTVDDATLEKIQSCGLAFHEAMATYVRGYRKHQKIHGTYLDAWLTEIERYSDRRLHPKIHSTTTDTGRTSSSGPNVQNIPDEGRECVTSRHGSVGCLVEADFKQLEVSGLAEVSNCPDLIHALVSGTDIHYESGKSVYGWKHPSEMTKDQRRIVKTINFGLIYGGSAKTLAEQAGVDLDTAQDLINGFYDKFPGVKRWQTANYGRVVESIDQVVTEGPSGTITSNLISTPTGRKYAFPLEPPPSWLPTHIAAKRGPSPSPTKVKNYPVQGFATGDVVPLAVMLIWKELRKGTDIGAILVNVVHDSVLIDCINPAAASKAATALRHVVNVQLPAALESLWGIELKVPLAIDISLLKTWKTRR